MAGQAIQIAILADAGKAVSEFKSTGSAANTMAADFDRAGDRIRGLEETFDKAASKSAQLSGGIGDIGGALVGLGGEDSAIGKIGMQMEAVAPIIMGVTGAMDILNLATNANAIAWIKNAAASVASRTAMVAGAVATGAMTAAQSALNVVMMLNPFGLVVIAILALVAAFVIAYKKSETFRKIVDAAWKGIKAASLAVFNFLKGYFVATFNFLKSIFTKGIEAFKTIWAGIVAVAQKAVEFKNRVVAVFNSAITWLKAAGQRIIDGLRNAITSGYSKITGAISAIKNRITGALSGAANWLKDAGRKVIQGLIDGITAMISSLKDKLSSITNLIPDWKGPARRDAKLLYKSGKLIMGGLIGGIDDKTSDLRRTLGGVTSMIEGGVQPSLGTMGVGTAAMSPAALSGSGGRAIVNNVTVQVGPTADLAEVGRQIKKALSAYETTYGRTA